MANILLTESCVRSCPYCFAKKHMADSSDRFITWENLIYIADLLEASNEKRVSLLGGEPTLHPNFTDFCMYLLEREFHVNIFTSGILSDQKLNDTVHYLHNVHPDKFSFTCNINHPDLSSQVELEKIDKFLRAFRQFTSLGFNIFYDDFDITFVVETINKYHLKRNVRIGLTHPIPNESNKYVPIKDMRKMALRFKSFIPLFQRFNISPSFDCGMPMCIFSEEDLGELYKISNGRLVFGCGPAVDIGPDMMVWSCFPLSGLEKRSLFDFNSIQEIIGFYKSVHDKVRTETGGIYEECDTCSYRANHLCMGGCIAHFAANHIKVNSFSQKNKVLE